MKKVSDYYLAIEQKHGLNAANAFLRLMMDWDGGKDVSRAFYSVDVLEMKLAEALETV